MARQQTISRKYFRAEIQRVVAIIEEREHDLHRANARIEALTRESHRLFDELSEANLDRDKQQVVSDDLAAKVNRMGEELGRANQRIERLRQVADAALLGLATCAAATNQHGLVSTLLALERDGRAQLAKALNGNNGNGGHA